MLPLLFSALALLFSGSMLQEAKEARRQSLEAFEWSFTKKVSDCGSIFSNHAYVQGSVYNTSKPLIGITGLSGEGKSSLINMLLRKDSAAVGQGESTLQAQVYEHASAFLVDLPGSSARFTMGNYSRLFGLKCFDVIILVINRVSEFDDMVLREAATFEQRYGQKLIVVYSKPLQRTVVRNRSCSVWQEQCNNQRLHWILKLLPFAQSDDCDSALEECQFQLVRHVERLSQRINRTVLAVDTRYPDCPWQNATLLRQKIQNF